MAKNKASNARRREVRRNLSAGSRPLLERMRDRRVLWPVVFGLALVLIGGTVANLGHQRVPYEVGQVVDDPVVARVSFTTIDEEKTEEERHDARLRQPSIFKPHQDYLQGVREKLIGLAELATDTAIESIDQVPAETRESLKIDARTLRDLRQLVNNPDQPAWPQQVERFVTEGLASLPILSSSAKRVERNPRQRPSHIVLQHPSNREMVRYDHAILSPEDDQRAIQSALRSFLNNKVPSSVSESMVAAVTQNLQPTYIVNQELTEQRRAQRAEAVEPVKITYQPGEVVVSAGHALSRLDRQVIHEEQRAYWEALHPSVQIAKMASRYGLLALIAIALWSYLRSYADRVVTNPMRGLAITSLILLCQGLSVMGAITLPTTYLLPSIVLPTLLVAIVLTIAYDRRTALAVGIMHALVVVLSLNTTIGQELIVLTGVAVAVAQLKEVRTRSKLVLTGFNTGLAMGFAAAAVGVLAWPLLNVDANSPSALPTRDLQQIGISVGNMILTGIAAGLIVQGILPFIERVFNVSTAMTLKELNDASHPLLRQLAERAPGTYQHSLRIADMSEAAAEAIGCDGLLCRVGAMYHDIGKVNKPQYFVENQQGGPNRHKKLSPAMSHLIIIGHVKDGVEMAREYGLPPSIRQFIETHHGTTLVAYFYHAAKERSEEEDKPGPSEYEFRYPGPKPQNRESAILMLCDAIEGAVRSIEEPTAARIEQMVRQISQNRLTDGQLDECPITLRDVHKIEQSLVKTLCAIYHSRIKYPGQDSDEDAEDTAPPADARPAAGA